MGSRSGGGKEVLSTGAIVVGVGVGVAAFSALGLGALGVGVIGASAFESFTARRAKPALQPDGVKRDEQGRIENWGRVLRAVQDGGIAPELRAELWPLLLGVFPHHSSQQERQQELQQLRRLYIKLVLLCKELDEQLQALRGATASGAAAPAGGGGEPASAGQSARSEAGSSGGAPPGAAAPPPLPGGLAAFAEAHRIIVMDAARTDLRRGVPRPAVAGGGATGAGAGPALTILPVSVGEGLPELMLAGPPPADPTAPSSADELAAIAADPAAAAAAGRLPRWRSALAADMIWGAAHLDDPHRHQMLRLTNILSAYALHDPETGYCQGMSDLASVFVQLFDDDALAFACFERLMRGARRNFKHDETGIRYQLQQIARVLRDTDPTLWRKLRSLGADDCMFAYRMVVVALRRELPPEACCTLWEMQWAHEAAEAEAAAALASGALSGALSGGGRAASFRQATPAASEGGGAGAAAAAASGLRSTVQGLSEATASARAAAALAQRPGSAGAARAGGSARLSAAATDGRSGEGQPPEFVLQFIAAVVRAQRGRIMADCHEHDDVLRLFNSLTIEFWPAVAQARKQHKAYVGW